jgi:hypothetical protein
MTPDDMEAVVERLEKAAGDPVPWPDLRALLLDYQERGRALEAASPVVPVGREEITAILESHIGAAAWSGDAEVHGIPEAADAILAALGTKGTDHD